MIEPIIILSFWLLVLAVILVFKSPAGLKANLPRFIVVSCLCLFGSIAAAILSLYIQGLFLLKSDMAYGLGIWQTLKDPFVRNVMFFFSIPIGIGLSPFAFRCTFERSLARCTLFVLPVTAIAVATLSPLNSFIAMIGSLPVGILSLWFCNKTKLTFFVKNVPNHRLQSIND